MLPLRACISDSLCRPLGGRSVRQDCLFQKPCFPTFKLSVGFLFNLPRGHRGPFTVVVIEKKSLSCVQVGTSGRPCPCFMESMSSPQDATGQVAAQAMHL